jgi:hypothetical protein
MITISYHKLHINIMIFYAVRKGSFHLNKGPFGYFRWSRNKSKCLLMVPIACSNCVETKLGEFS